MEVYYTRMYMKCMYVKFGTGTPEANMAVIWSELLAWWALNPCRDRFHSLKLSMWINVDDPHNGMPKLKGRAMEVKTLVPALCAVWEGHMNNGLPEHLAVHELLRCSARMDEVLDSHPDADLLPPHALADFVECSWMYAQCQNACGVTVLCRAVMCVTVVCSDVVL